MIARGLLLAGLLALGAAASAGGAPPPVPLVSAITGPAMPATLAEFGFFADPRAQLPAAGVIPYRLNTPLYSDGAEKLRFLYLPPGTEARFADDGLPALPVGAALIKTFAFGEGAGRRLVETRVLLHRAEGWVALPYVWDEGQSEARLALAGARVPVTTPEGRAISYRVPNRNQCKECHGLNGAVVPIGPKARNLSAAWLAPLVAAGKVNAVPAGADSLPRWEDRATVPVAAAARAYLDVNCAHCHRPGAAASNSGLDLRWEQQDLHALGVMKRPVAAGRGAGAFEFDIVPGHPERSILVHRMRIEEPGVAMPELGKATADAEGTALIERWISAL